jgi:hypothetical protein
MRHATPHILQMQALDPFHRATLQHYELTLARGQDLTRPASCSSVGFFSKLEGANNGAHGPDATYHPMANRLLSTEMCGPLL